MRSALIVSGKRTIGEVLAKLLKTLSYENVDITNSAQEARRKVQRNQYELIIIDTPLSHEFGTELALDIMEKNESDIILLVKNDSLARAELNLKSVPVLITSKPINKSLLIREIRFISNYREKNERLISQNRKLKKKLSSLKDQFRAKLLLMKNLGLSEEEAHTYLQKHAMDQQRTPGEIARSIIDLYE